MTKSKVNELRQQLNKAKNDDDFSLCMKIQSEIAALEKGRGVEDLQKKLENAKKQDDFAECMKIQQQIKQLQSGEDGMFLFFSFSKLIT